mgnify:CR=1 FL=1
MLTNLIYYLYNIKTDYIRKNKDSYIFIYEDIFYIFKPTTLNEKYIFSFEDIFTMGYPMAQVMGSEIKVTDGIISSKTGYEGQISAYQISAPIQPGNSGGPMFDKEGNLVGITSAGIPGANNVGYAIKSSYLYQLMDAAPISIDNITDLNSKPNDFVKLIKEFVPYVVMVLIY